MGKLIAVAVLAAVLIGAVPQASAFGWQKRYDAWLATLPPEGEAPSPEYVQRAVVDYFKYRLKDPDSAKYEFGAIERGTWRGAFERSGTPGWVASVLVNGKNSYGAYIGFQEYKFIFRSGSIVEVYEYRSREKAWLGHIGMKGQPIPPLP